MRWWLLLWKLEVLLVALMVVGCITPAPAVRVETGAAGETWVSIPRTIEAEPVQVPPKEVTQAIQRMARQVRLSGSPRDAVERLFQLDALYSMATTCTCSASRNCSRWEGALLWREL